MKKIKIASLLIIFVVSFSTSNLVFAQESTQINLTTIGTSVIDLDSLEKDRVIRTFAEFSNFDLSHKFYVMEILERSSGYVMYRSEIIVGSTASGLVSFNSHVIYVITDEMLEEGSVIPGDYQMQIKNKNESVIDYVDFTIRN